jgi:hypothetical protein
MVWIFEVFMYASVMKTMEGHSSEELEYRKVFEDMPGKSLNEQRFHPGMGS